MADPLSRDGGCVHHSADPPERTAGQSTRLQCLTPLNSFKTAQQPSISTQSEDKRTMDCEAGFTNGFDIAQDTLPAVSHPVEIKDGKPLFWLKQKVHITVTSYAHNIGFMHEIFKQIASR